MCIYEMTKKEIIDMVELLVMWSYESCRYHEEIEIFSNKLKYFMEKGKLIEEGEE